MSQLTSTITTDRPAAGILDAATLARARSALMDLAELSKLRITVMVAVTAWLGYQLGVADAGAMASASWLLLTATLVGTAWSCIGASVFNQVMERDVDALMHRTRNRPLPAGRMAPRHALLYGLIAAAAGVTTLALFTTPLAAGLSAFTIAAYTFIYTPMKRTSPASTIVGAVPGALPPVIGYAAATNTVAAPALAVFAIMFLWQLPHFYAIAWLYREDYARAGMPMLPVLDPTGASTFRQMLLYCAILVPVGMLPTFVGVSGMLYGVGALVAGLTFMAFAVVLVRRRTRAAARAMFFASLVYLPAVLLLLCLDRV
ncbi:MAG: heme o synthase [Phycisphaeraceae bacterium]